MASRYEKFFDNVYVFEGNYNTKGFIKQEAKDRLSFDDDTIYEIPFHFNFRPDRIAQRFYGDPKLYWILVYVNNISDSPEGFYHGRKIRIPRTERILEVI